MQVKGGIFYCRVSAGFSISASIRLSCNLTVQCFEIGNKTIPPTLLNKLFNLCMDGPKITLYIKEKVPLWHAYRLTRNVFKMCIKLLVTAFHKDPAKMTYIKL